jgi:hypothetical protein
METFYSVAPRIIFVLGVVNLLTGLVIFSSCRCIQLFQIPLPCLEGVLAFGDDTRGAGDIPLRVTRDVPAPPG